MRAVVQRVTEASVAVSGDVVGSITGPGLVVLLGVTHDDTPAIAERLAEKIWGLRILEGELSCSDVGAPLLVISQFTLYADVRKGRRPSWSDAAPGDVGEPLVDASWPPSRPRRRGADRPVRSVHAGLLTNDGPVTLVIDSDMWPKKA